MERFVPFEKLSKKEKRKQNRLKRSTWGPLSPVTRRSANPKAYNRKRHSGRMTATLCLLIFRSSEALTYRGSTSKAPASARPGRYGR